MKLIFVLALVLLLIFTSRTGLVSGLTTYERYESGYNHGCSDAKAGGHPYFDTHPTHTKEFTLGYTGGYKACSDDSAICSELAKSSLSLLKITGVKLDKNTCKLLIDGSAPKVKPVQPNENWWGTCKAIEWGLVSPCSTYVKPDGTLTREGNRAKDCISDGAFLGGGAKLIGGWIPTDWIIDGLKYLAPSYDCENIVKWDELKKATNALDFFGSLA